MVFQGFRSTNQHHQRRSDTNMIYSVSDLQCSLKSSSWLLLIFRDSGTRLMVVLQSYIQEHFIQKPSLVLSLNETSVQKNWLIMQLFQSAQMSENTLRTEGFLDLLCQTWPQVPCSSHNLTNIFGQTSTGLLKRRALGRLGNYFFYDGD